MIVYGNLGSNMTAMTQANIILDVQTNPLLKRRIKMSKDDNVNRKWGFNKDKK